MRIILFENFFKKQPTKKFAKKSHEFNILGVILHKKKILDGNFTQLILATDVSLQNCYLTFHLNHLKIK